LIAQHENRLPFHLSGADSKRKKCALLSDRCRRGGSRLSPLLALPSGVFAGNSRMVWNLDDGFKSFTADRRIRIR
jgi:hypothetical protein